MYLLKTSSDIVVKMKIGHFFIVDYPKIYKNDY